VSEISKGATRRAILHGSLGLLALAGTARAEDSKVPQSAVAYQNSPKDGQKCELCANWQPPNACKIVAGTISPQGYCVAFAPKGS
jgi:hypothetical protein